MLCLLACYEVADYEKWSQGFAADRFGRATVARGHELSRSVENPNVVIVRIEFDSVIEANAFRERLKELESDGALTIKLPPTVMEVSERQQYAPQPDGHSGR